MHPACVPLIGQRNPIARVDDYGFRLAYKNVNKKPESLATDEPLSVMENKPSGTVVGQFTATDPDGDELTFRLVGEENNNSLFSLDAHGTLRTATSFDYESNQSSYVVGVQDPYHAFIESSFTVHLLDDDTEDRDGDGFTDGQEAEAGTDPDSNTSMPGIDYGLVAWYPFDGNASDMSGNGNNGTVYGATLGTDRHGQAKTVLTILTGMDDYISVYHDPNLNLTGEFSIISGLMLKVLI